MDSSSYDIYINKLPDLRLYNHGDICEVFWVDKNTTLKYICDDCKDNGMGVAYKMWVPYYGKVEELNKKLLLI